MTRFAPHIILAGLFAGLLTYSIFAVGKIRDLRAERDTALRQIHDFDTAFEAYKARRVQEEAASQARQSNLEAEIARYEKALAEADRACPLDASDLEWLRKH